jgi:Na+-translocating ferredoxin:NAD+ oxidoreductase subunit B
MSTDHRIYRLLQRHLDKQTVGFPAALLGSDIRLLRRIFTLDEAKIALHLSYKPASLDEIAAKAAPEFSADRTRLHLDSMFKKGGVAWKKRDSIDTWYLTPLVIGIYENAQDGIASSEFLDRADAYMKSLPFGRVFMTAQPSQMRTIPISKSISMSHPVSTYDQIRGILQDAPGPFVVIPCICREKTAVRGNRCKKTIRKETCFAMNNIGTMILRRGHGREISRDEAAELFRQSEADGLVLQPSNAEQPEFICSCCGCCCGMLSFQKFLPSPVDYWTAHYQATVDQAACTHCGTCVSRCQVNAVALAGPERIAAVDTNRCIGCGLCVATCPGKAITLNKKPQETPLPKNEEALYDALMKNKKGPREQWMEFFKTAVRIKKPWARHF